MPILIFAFLLLFYFIFFGINGDDSSLLMSSYYVLGPGLVKIFNDSTSWYVLSVHCICTGTLKVLNTIPEG